MFETKIERLVSISVFVSKMALSIVMSGILIVVALLIGIIGYYPIAGFDWADSLC